MQRVGRVHNGIFVIFGISEYGMNQIFLTARITVWEANWKASWSHAIQGRDILCVVFWRFYLYVLFLSFEVETWCYFTTFKSTNFGIPVEIRESAYTILQMFHVGCSCIFVSSPLSVCFVSGVSFLIEKVGRTRDMDGVQIRRIVTGTYFVDFDGGKCVQHIFASMGGAFRSFWSKQIGWTVLLIIHHISK